MLPKLVSSFRFSETDDTGGSPIERREVTGIFNSESFKSFVPFNSFVTENDSSLEEGVMLGSLELKEGVAS